MNANVVEKYTLCLLKEREKDISVFWTGVPTVHLALTMLLDMIKDENIELAENGEIILKSKEFKKEYSKELFEMIEKKNKSMKLYNILELCYYVNSKDMFNMVKTSMLSKGMLNSEMKNTLFGEKQINKINEEVFENLINEVRKDILENVEVSKDNTLLLLILNESKILKNFFNKYEQEKLKLRIKELQKDEIYEKVELANKVINTILASEVVIWS